MRTPNNSPAIFYLRNRLIILAASPFVIAFCFFRILSNLRSDDPWLNWFFALIVWANLLALAIRRRLTLTPLGIDYTDFFTPVHIPWSQVTRVAPRRVFDLWTVEGLDVWVESPRLKEFFIDLTQFSKSWRGTVIGSILRTRVPHLFQ